MLVEQPERTLLGLVALAGQVLQGLLAGEHLAAAHNAAVLVLHQILLGQTTGGVLGRAVENLGLGANCDHLRHLILLTAVLFYPCSAGGRAAAVENLMAGWRGRWGGQQ